MSGFLLLLVMVGVVAGAHDGLWQILMQKSFWDGERKLLEPLDRKLTRGDVRDPIISLQKWITDLRSGLEKRRSSREAQKSTFARFLGLFDFRLLQQYRHQPDHPRCPQPGADGRRSDMAWTVPFGRDRPEVAWARLFQPDTGGRIESSRSARAPNSSSLASASCPKGARP